MANNGCLKHDPALVSDDIELTLAALSLHSELLEVNRRVLSTVVTLIRNATTVLAAVRVD